MELPTNANIIEINDGPFYPVHLTWVPRLGDYIDLTSLVELAQHRLDRHRLQYEVVAVIHVIQDVNEKTDRVSKGSHWVNVYVEPIEIPTEFCN